MVNFAVRFQPLNLKAKYLNRYFYINSDCGQYYSGILEIFSEALLKDRSFQFTRNYLTAQ